MPAVVPITRKFTQVGKPANIVVQYKAGEAPNENEETDPNILKVNVSKDKVVNDKLTITAANGIDMKVGKITLNVLGGTIQLGRSNLSGFGLKPGVYQGLIRELQTALLVPSQELTREIFEGTAKVNGLEISKSMPLRNATNITMMFPKSPLDITCFDNIMYQNVQLVVNKRTYPDTEFSNTCSARFYQHQLIANELDGCLQATQEFED